MEPYSFSLIIAWLGCGALSATERSVLEGDRLASTSLVSKLFHPYSVCFISSIRQEAVRFNSLALLIFEELLQLMPPTGRPWLLSHYPLRLCLLTLSPTTFRYFSAAINFLCFTRLYGFCSYLIDEISICSSRLSGLAQNSYMIRLLALQCYLQFPAGVLGKKHPSWTPKGLLILSS